MEQLKSFKEFVRGKPRKFKTLIRKEFFSGHGMQLILNDVILNYHLTEARIITEARYDDDGILIGYDIVVEALETSEQFEERLRAEYDVYMKDFFNDRNADEISELEQQLSEFEQRLREFEQKIERTKRRLAELKM